MELGESKKRISCPLTSAALYLLKRKIPGICAEETPLSILILKYTVAFGSCLLFLQGNRRGQVSPHLPPHLPHLCKKRKKIN